MRPVPDCHCKTTPMLSNEEAVEMAEKQLIKIKNFPDAWKMLYQCSACLQYWELSYPAAGDVCCVEPELCKLSLETAKADYHL